MNVMTAIPTTVSFTPTTVDSDKTPSYVTAMVCTQDDKLVFADCHNYKVKVVSLTKPDTVSAFIKLDDNPSSLALLPDGTIAVTSLQSLSSPAIYLLKVDDDDVTVAKIKAGKRYRGVAGNTDGNLIVSCPGSHEDGPASVDIIRRDGAFVKTLCDGNSVSALVEPRRLCVDNGHVIVSDCGTDSLIVVDIATGVVNTLTNEDMKNPTQVCVDKNGNVYVACRVRGRGVMVKTRGGDWRRLVNYEQHSQQGNDWARAVCVTKSGRLVVAWSHFDKPSLLIQYELK